ncbi:MAG: PfkB family carbohydrate kinase [Planctomycetota bacterium]
MDVFAFGACVVDRFGVVEHDPALDTKQEMTTWLQACGGPPATAAVALARWGRSCAFGGVVGDDEEGDLIRADLAREGLDTSALLVRPGACSQYAFIAVERASGRRKIYWRRPTGAPPMRAEIELPPARLFLTDGLYAGISAELARAAPMTVVDAGTLRDGTRELIAEAEIYVASESFARAYVGEDDPEGCCRKLREQGVEVAGVTLGARGYVASFGDTMLHGEAVAVDAVDTTGCGDLFHAGVCEGVLAGWDWPRTFSFAAWAAAQVATSLGGRAGIPPWHNESQ